MGNAAITNPENIHSQIDDWFERAYSRISTTLKLIENEAIALGYFQLMELIAFD
jgi:hypothetical protein